MASGGRPDWGKQTENEWSFSKPAFVYRELAAADNFATVAGFNALAQFVISGQRIAHNKLRVFIIVDGNLAVTIGTPNNVQILLFRSLADIDGQGREYETDLQAMTARNQYTEGGATVTVPATWVLVAIKTATDNNPMAVFENLPPGTYKMLMTSILGSATNIMLITHTE